MKTFSFLIALTLSCASFTLNAAAKSPFEADYSQKDKPATIKVLIDKGVNSPLVEIKGRYGVYLPSSGLQLSSGIFGKRDLVSHSEKGMKWGELFRTVFEMRLVPGDSQTTIVVNGTEYRGCVEIYDVDGKFTIVNEIDIENYLKSTLNTKAIRQLDDEVMEAVAIVERTNAYFHVGKNPHALWHVVAKEVDYQGYGATLENIQVDKAVDSTRYVVMTYNQAPFATTWSKNCAGKTADFATLFRKNVSGPKGVQIAPTLSDREKAKWTVTLSKKELGSKLGLGAITSLDLFVDKSSNKVYGVRVGDRQNCQSLDFLTFQKKVGDKKLRSSDFSVLVKGDSIQFTGYGDGPGVGLCIYSADKMAENGDKAPKILSAFFPETKIENMRSLAPEKWKKQAANATGK
jgi:stage II sporulation protein D